MIESTRLARPGEKRFPHRLPRHPSAERWRGADTAVLIDKVDDFDPRNIRRRAKNHFDAAAVARIAVAFPMLVQRMTNDQLSRRLNRAVVNYQLASAWQKKPTTRQLSSRMDRIDKAAAELLRELGLGTRGRSHPDLMPFAVRAWFVGHARIGEGLSPDDTVRESVEGVKRIHGWAAEYKFWRRGELETGPKQQRHKADLALDRLIGELGAIWKDGTGQAPKAPSTIGGNSKNAGRPAGKYFRFVRAILEQLDLPVKDHGLRERMRRLYSKVRSAAKKI